MKHPEPKMGCKVSGMGLDDGITKYLKKSDINQFYKFQEEAIKEITQQDDSAKILVCSALGQELLVMEAIQAGAKDFIVKPFKKEKILDTIEKVLSE